MKAFALILAILLLTACYYEIPEAKKLGEKNISSTSDTFAEPEQKNHTIEDFNFATNISAAYTIKAVRNFYDGCNGCMDYVSASASAMIRTDDRLGYPFIVALLRVHNEMAL